MSTRHVPQAGFTLLELLVGLVVLGFILVSLNQGVRYGVRVLDTQTRTREATGDLDAVDRTLRRLVEQADPGNEHSGATLRGTGAMLAFTSDLPAAATGVTRHADLVLAVDAGHRLVLRWTPHTHARLFAPRPAPEEAELLRGVEQIQLFYWAGAWQSDWNRELLPALIRLRIVFPSGDPRHWSDIVIAPMRQRDAG